jgi:chemotaxis protein methyltransferase CheR
MGAMNLPGYEEFRRTLYARTGIDLDCYKGTQMERRLQTIMRRVGAGDLVAYAQLIARDPARLKEFQDFLTINVSEWLRNPEKWEELQQVILPELLRQSPRLKLWSAGCSNGSEPYSLSLLLHELDQAGNHQVLATDLDEEILKVARAGVYSEKDIRNLSPARRARYFEERDGSFVLRPELKARVRFERHNLLSDPFPVDLDLILCRNVVIYFTEEVKDELYRKFYKALRPGGILFVGGTESLLRAREFGFESVSPFFYRKMR